MSETVSVYFPDLLVQWTPQRGTIDRTDIEESGGREQRRARMQAGGRRTAVGDLQFLPPLTREVLREFVKGLRGAYLPFWLFFWDPEHFTDYQINAADNPMAFPIVLPFKLIGELEAIKLEGADVTNPFYTGTIIDPGLSPISFPILLPWILSAPLTTVMAGAFPAACVSDNGGVDGRGRILSIVGLSGGETIEIRADVATRGYLLDAGGPGGETRLLALWDGADPLGDGAVGEVTITLMARARMAARLASDRQAETFVRSSQVLAVRHLDAIEILNAVPGEGEPIPIVPPSPLFSTLRYEESTTAPDGVTKTFEFSPPIRVLHVPYIGGQGQRPVDASIIGGNLVFGASVAAPDVGEKVTASYWP